LWRPLDLEVVALLDQVFEDERPGEGDDPDHQQRAPEQRVDDRVELVLSQMVLEDRDRPDAEDRGGNAAGREPEGETQVDRLHAEVPPGTDGLGDRRVEDVGADRGGRLDAEDEDQHRGHQRSAAHPGHADEHADAKSEDDDCRVHRSFCRVTLL